MKAADIKPGVVYAWVDGNSEYARVRPVMFLVQPGPGHLYSKGARFTRTPEGQPVFVHRTRAGERASAGRGYSGLTIGYPAAGIPAHGTSQEAACEDAVKYLRANAGKLTLDAFKAATREVIGDEARWLVFPTLAKVKGEWDAYWAQRKEADEARAEAERVAREYKDARDARWDTVRIELGAVLGDGKPIPSFGQWDNHLRLSLEMCEELVSVLQVAREALLDDPTSAEGSK